MTALEIPVAVGGQISSVTINRQRLWSRNNRVSGLPGNKAGKTAVDRGSL